MSFSWSILCRVRRPLLAILLVSAAFSGFAHDPYGLTATAYLWTNRVDLTVVMEFRTGLRLAGVEPRPPAGVSTTNWFAENRAALLACGKSFCQIESGKNLLPVSAVEVTLGVEDHIEMQLEYPAATERPLRFDAAGLKTLAGQGQYGVALTVLDMVNGKVLGQPVIFADAPSFVAEVAPSAKDLASGSAIAAAPNAIVSPVNTSSSPDQAKKTPEKSLGWALISGVAVLLLLTFLRQRSPPKP
jgi:hypothetical protein